MLSVSFESRWRSGSSFAAWNLGWRSGVPSPLPATSGQQTPALPTPDPEKPNPLNLRRVEVLDAHVEAAKPIASFAGDNSTHYCSLLALRGTGTVAATIGNFPQGAAWSSFMWITLDRAAHLPNRLRHRVLTADLAVDGAVIGTHHTELEVLGPPVEGAGIERHLSLRNGPLKDWSERRDLNSRPLAPHGIHRCNGLQRSATD